jgi:hypothetical protein
MKQQGTEFSAYVEVFRVFATLESLEQPRQRSRRYCQEGVLPRGSMNPDMKRVARVNPKGIFDEFAKLQRVWRVFTRGSLEEAIQFAHVHT